MNLNIKKEDIAINPDGTIAVLNPEVKEKIEKSLRRTEETDDTNINCHGCFPK